MDRIEEIRREVTNNSLSIDEINAYLELVIRLKFENIDNDKEYNKLSHIQEYLEHKVDINNHVNLNLISLLNLFFLPLGVIVGYFGMNFNSMGVNTLSKGVYKEQDGFRLVIMLSVISFIISYLIHNYHHTRRKYY
jgi:Mg2+ and Co2+ transporter CorA